MNISVETLAFFLVRLCVIWTGAATCLQLLSSKCRQIMQWYWFGPQPELRTNFARYWDLNISKILGFECMKRSFHPPYPSCVCLICNSKSVLKHGAKYIHNRGVDVDKKVEPLPQLAGWEGWEQDGSLWIQTNICKDLKIELASKTRSDYVESERSPHMPGLKCALKCV